MPKNLAGQRFCLQSSSGDIGHYDSLFTLIIAGLGALLSGVEVEVIAVYFTALCWIGTIWVFFATYSHLWRQKHPQTGAEISSPTGCQRASAALRRERRRGCDRLHNDMNMAHSVLIAYATKYGATEEIAGKIGEVPPSWIDRGCAARGQGRRCHFLSSGGLGQRRVCGIAAR